MTASAGPALRRLHQRFGDRVAFVTLYVREAHPGERCPQADDFEQKLAHARAYRERDELAWPVAVDDVEGTLHRRLDPKPNAAYVVDSQGRVAARLLWSNDERVLRDALEAVLAERSAGDREPRLIPMLAGAGQMWDVVGAAGDDARRDVLREAPPMLLMARIAALFKPLPSLWRGVAASAVMMLALAMLARRRG